MTRAQAICWIVICHLIPICDDLATSKDSHLLFTDDFLFKLHLILIFYLPPALLPDMKTRYTFRIPGNGSSLHRTCTVIRRHVQQFKPSVCARTQWVVLVAMWSIIVCSAFKMLSDENRVHGDSRFLVWTSRYFSSAICNQELILNHST